MTSLRVFLGRITALPPIGPAEDLDSWRDRLLDSLMKMLTPLGVLPLIPSLIIFTRADVWWTAGLHAGVFVVLMFVAFHPKVSSKIRGITLVAMLYVLGITLLMSSSRIGAATVWVVFASILATVLFDRAGLVISSAFNLLIVASVAGLVSYFGAHVIEGLVDLSEWLGTASSLVFVAFACSILVWGAVFGLRAAMRSSRDAYQALEESHEQLRLAHAGLETETEALLAAEAERRAESEMREKLEVQLRESQKMEAVGRLAGGIAHDFNNMLTAILGFADLTREQLDHDDQACSDVDEIRRAAERAQIMTRQLLALSRRQITQPQAIRLAQYIGDWKPVVAQLVGASVELEFDLEQDDWPVLIDPGQLDQIVLNLVVNARDAMPDGGRLILRTGNERLTPAPHHVLADGRTISGPYAVLTVSDTGRGMTPEVKERIFEPFFTTKSHGSGTGLGLATVYGIVAQHGGFMEVESGLDEGTEMRVYLPRTDALPAPEARDLPRGPAVGMGNLLLVEDEANVRRLALRVLEKAGYGVLEAGSPAEAIALLEAGDYTIDLLVTDVVLPGMNGKQLYERLIPDRPGLRVLYMSGYAEDAIARQGSLPPGTDLLEKPFHPSTLTDRVAAALARPA